MTVSDRTLGVLLVVLGLLLVVGQWLGVGAEAIVALVGIGFLTAYTATRAYGLLIPGAILTGLGAGIIVAAAGGPDGAVVLGLGLGFLAIAVVDRSVARWARPGWWWPLVPGGILSTVGMSQVPELDPVGRFVLPLALVAVGLWLLVAAPRSRRRAPARVEVDVATVDDE